MSLVSASLVVLSLSLCLYAETLGVYLDKPIPAPAAASFREELHNLLKDTGIAIELRSLKDRKSGESFDRLMVIQLRGTCDAFEAPRKSSGPLASTQVEGSRILPYAELFCDRLRSTLSATLDREPLFRRHQLTGRAMARVLAHEIYHYLTQEKNHASIGVARNCLNSRELLTDGFTFDHHTLTRLRATPEPQPVYTEAEEASGR